MNRTDTLSRHYEAGFFIFMGVLAFLGRNNPNLHYPQVLYLFALLMILNLAATTALRLKPSTPSLSAGIILANCGVITAILSQSGGASSNLWVLYFLPIFTVCLLLGARETAWITAGVTAFNAAFTLSSTADGLAVAAFEIMLKSGAFAFTAIAAWRLASRDRDARARLQAESAKALQLTSRLENAAALSDVGLVSAGVAHDLRNTFMVIGGFSESILQDDGLGAEARDGLERIRRMAKLGGEMSHHLARHGADARLALAADDLNEISSGMAGLVKTVFLEKSARLEVEPSPEPCPIRASRVHIQRLLLNLLLNALSVTAPGKLVRMTIRRSGNEAVAAFEDEGPGFPPEMMGRLFGAYETTRASSGGTGLGLNLCARIAKEHGGSLSAENRAEGGARLVLRLPLSAA